MKKEFKGFILGVVTTVVVGSGVGFAASQLTSIDVYPNNVTIALSGDVTDIPSFTYNDRTYVELRPVLENIDCVVSYDAENNIVNAYNRYQKGIPTIIDNGSGTQYETIMDLKAPLVQNALYVNEWILNEAGLIFVPDRSVQDNVNSWYSPILGN